MSIGTVIAVKQGSGYVRVDPELEAALTEVRVEQYLDSQTTFALRFQEDFENEEPKLTEHELFNNPSEIAILVPDGSNSDTLVCLVRGQLEQLAFDVALGGPGSWFEARGRDIRTVIGRVSGPRQFPKTTSREVILQLINDLDGIEHNVAPGQERYDEDSGGPPALIMSGTAIEMIEALAAGENHSVWLSYEAETSASGISITTTLNVDRSPKPGPARTPALRVLTDPKKCPNVASFSISSDNERIKIIKGSALDEQSGGSAQITAESATEQLNKDGPGVKDAGNAKGPLGQVSEKPERSCFSAGGGGPTVRAAKAEAMATEAAWYVEAELLTSANMYDSVLQPHEKVSVLGVGAQWAGDYQVREVTHVINAAEHWMNVKLRSDSRGGKRVP